MVEWCHCPQGDPINKVLYLLSALLHFLPSFLETLHKQGYTPLCCINWQWRPVSHYSSVFHAAVASCCFWFSWVTSVLVIHLQAVLTTYTLAIFTTMSVYSLQCWLHFDYWLLHLLSSTHIILRGHSDEIHPCCSRATYGNRFSSLLPDDRLVNIARTQLSYFPILFLCFVLSVSVDSKNPDGTAVFVALEIELQISSAVIW